MSARIDAIDAAYPTIVRLAGLLLVFLCTGGIAFGIYELSAGYVPALGMILLKTVKDATVKPEPES